MASLAADPRRVAIGVDVGTGSARSGVFTLDGKLLGSAVRDIRLFQPEGHPGFYQQSSEDIWAAVCEATKEALASAGMSGESVVGMGFDATCSLVALDSADAPLSVDPSNDGADTEGFVQNVIVWLDHRATEQAQRINDGGYPQLRTVGGKISPEMEMPKILWLKEERPQTFAQVGKFLDLADFLVYRATGRAVRYVTDRKSPYVALPAIPFGKKICTNS